MSEQLQFLAMVRNFKHQNSIFLLALFDLDIFFVDLGILDVFLDRKFGFVNLLLADLSSSEIFLLRVKFGAFLSQPFVESSCLNVDFGILIVTYLFVSMDDLVELSNFTFKIHYLICKLSPLGSLHLDHLAVVDQ